MNDDSSFALLYHTWENGEHRPITCIAIGENICVCHALFPVDVERRMDCRFHIGSIEVEWCLSLVERTTTVFSQ